MVAAILDSWAVLRYLEGHEPAASRTDAVIGSGDALMSWINLGEVYDVLTRIEGEDAAEETIRELSRRVQVEAPGEQRVIEAARIKAHHRMAYADAFAAATAVAHDVPLLTGDPELLLQGSSWRWEDLRGPADRG